MALSTAQAIGGLLLTVINVYGLAQYTILLEATWPLRRSKELKDVVWAFLALAGECAMWLLFVAEGFVWPIAQPMGPPFVVNLLVTFLVYVISILIAFAGHRLRKAYVGPRREA